MNILNPEALFELCKEFYEEKPVKKTIVFSLDGIEHSADIYVRRLSYEDTAAIDAAYLWEPDENDPEELTFKGIEGKSLQAAHLLGSICIDDKGTKFFEDVQHVLRTHPNVCRAMYAKADEVNNFWGKSKNQSSKETKSGQNSPLAESEETQLQNANENSATKSSVSGVSTEEEGEA